MSFATLPKIELHLHLEGAAPPRFIAGLAGEKSRRLESVFDAQGGYAFEGFHGFLRTYEAATSVLETPQDFARLTDAVLDIQAREGVIYTEVFLSPDFCGGGDLAAWREFVDAIGETAARRAATDGTVLRGIVTCVRHFGPERARAAALCAAETAGPFIVGFGMGGDETVGHARDYAWAFDCAREAGLGLTSHAGEWAGPSSVRETMEVLGVRRIGHGVRAVEDPRLMETLAEAGTVLEVCPGSNIALGLSPSWDAHPIERLRRAGITVTVSTDDPPFFHTRLTAEYDRLAETFEWDRAQVQALNRAALDAAFCDADTKAALAARLDAAEKGD